jgi:hypothetical protein
MDRSRFMNLEHASAKVNGGARQARARMVRRQRLRWRSTGKVRALWVAPGHRTPTRFERDFKTVVRLYRHISHSVCPWNVMFSRELAEGSPFRARAFLDGKDSVTLARDICALDQEQFSAAFRKSPMKRAKLVGIRRNAAVALENTS